MEENKTVCNALATLTDKVHDQYSHAHSQQGVRTCWEEGYEYGEVNRVGGKGVDDRYLLDDC